jgi:hypothetical protein
MKKIRHSKLALRTETLRLLDDRMLTTVAGGASGYYTRCTCNQSEQGGPSCTPPTGEAC